MRYTDLKAPHHLLIEFFIVLTAAAFTPSLITDFTSKILLTVNAALPNPTAAPTVYKKK